TNVTNVAVTCATNAFSVGGTVSGLIGTVVLQVNGGSNLSVSENGPFTFTSQLANGTPYAVTVLTQPVGQSCSVTGGTGTTPVANVRNVGVSCVANTYTVGGTMSGLSGSVVLRNNGGSDLTVSANGGFTFPTALQNGSAYSVSVLTQPARQTCVVSNGAGTVSGTSVATVAVNCTTNTFSVGGTVSGIAGTVVLQNNGTDSISISGNGVFAFPTAVADGGAYSVAVLTQPANQTCTVVNGAGTASGADVSNVGVNCVANTFALSGTVSGLSGSVVLQNNGGNNLTVLANGGFTFLTALTNGSAHNVTVLTH